MVEAPDEAECEEVLGRLVAVAKRALGRAEACARAERT